ncbi:pectate lyase family protein [Uliginosibacterium aquaticum]|uniref:Pectate lyase n=1 Tax=Uliginosibacterium aquaticum TaxID=2731212 RepID=A0ABX2IH17_9RHOO|nr:pectate lyase [Uliginosibacterium aquaticum]NSL56016.1 pectate lyase [Uliginosibacterium aquaticum]
MQQLSHGLKATLLTSILSVALTACGGGGGGSSSETTSTASSSPSQTSASSAANSTAATSSSKASSSVSSTNASATSSSVTSSTAASSAATSSTAATSSSKASSSVSSTAASSVAGGAAATTSGGFSTATGGNVTSARKFTAASHTEINTIIANARYDDAGTKVATGAYPLHITYTGNEDALIAQIVADSTIDANHDCPAPHWDDAYRYVEVKNYTAGITIEGANGSSANFGIVINGGSNNVIVRNMKIGALGGASNDADMFRIDGGSNVWIDHNEMFAVNNECNGSPDGDLTFESAIDIKKASHNITVSYNYIHDSKKVGLDGSSSSDIDGGREISYHHNYYKNVNARLPLQRGGWIHVYNNLYDGISDSGINTRQAGYALIESNYFQNAKNPVVCFYDGGSNCGFWDLRNNNITSTADFTTYNITWSTPSSGDKSASNWTTTGAFPITLPYTYTPHTPACVKANLPSVAGVGKAYATLSCN